LSINIETTNLYHNWNLLAVHYPARLQQHAPPPQPRVERRCPTRSTDFSTK
jgi:hypothetical protein